MLLTAFIEKLLELHTKKTFLFQCIRPKHSGIFSKSTKGAKVRILATRVVTYKLLRKDKVRRGYKIIGLEDILPLIDLPIEYLAEKGSIYLSKSIINTDAIRINMGEWNDYPLLVIGGVYTLWEFWKAVLKLKCAKHMLRNIKKKLRKIERSNKKISRWNGDLEIQV